MDVEASTGADVPATDTGIPDHMQPMDATADRAEVRPDAGPPYQDVMVAQMVAGKTTSLSFAHPTPHGTDRHRDHVSGRDRQPDAGVPRRALTAFRHPAAGVQGLVLPPKLKARG
jgi:hypothetical protein